MTGLATLRHFVARSRFCRDSDNSGYAIRLRSPKHLQASHTLKPLYAIKDNRQSKNGTIIRKGRRERNGEGD